MEGISTQLLSSLKYKKLERTPSGISARRRVARLGSGRRKRSWKIPRLFRVRFRIPSPKKLLLRLRDVYVNSMLMLAGDKLTAKREVKVKVGDFEMRLMQHVYNSLLSTPKELPSCV